MTHSDHPHPKTNQSIVKLIECVAGIYFFYLLYGVMQEKLTSNSYGGDKYSSSLFILFIQCIFNCLTAGVVLLFDPSPKFGGDSTSFFLIAASYIGAMFSSNYALGFISYPTQALAKSCKMVPVMIGGILGGKKYSKQQYARVAMITFGIFVFMLKKLPAWLTTSSTSTPATSTPVDTQEAIGLGLALLSLVLDGVTTAREEHVLAKHHPTTSQLMFFINLWSIPILFTALIVFQQLSPAVSFYLGHPEALQDLALYSLASAFGQLFVFKTIRHFGTLVCSLVTTTRKFFTIMASVFFFGHALKSWQWGGVALVFIGLSWDLYDRFAYKPVKKVTKKEN